MKVLTREEQAKLYLVHQLHSIFDGKDCIGGIKQGREGWEIYFYGPEGMPKHEVMGALMIGIKQDAITGEDALSKVSVSYAPYEEGGFAENRHADEQMYRLIVTGSLREVADNVEKMDKAGFDAAMASHPAKAIIEREAAKAATRGSR